MNRWIFVAGTALTFIFMPSIVPSTARASDAYTYAVGGGFSSCPPGSSYCVGKGQHFAFSAQQDLSTLAYSGHAVFWFVDSNGYKVLQLQGPVTCLVTSGTTEASVTFQVAKAQTFTPHDGTSPPAAPAMGTLETFDATDGGPPSNDADSISPPSPAPVTPPSQAQVNCAGGGTQEPITSGNVTIGIDGPLPCVAMTDNSTYNNVTDSCSVYYNAGEGWQLAS